MKILVQYMSIFFITLVLQPLYAFDHQHQLWDSLLQQNVHLISHGQESRVDYKHIKKDPSQLTHYLERLSSVNTNDFQKWSISEQKAFLINAYNAFTIELVLSRYPEINSIKDIGTFFSSPWKKNFFILLNKKRSLDELEHTILRKKGRYDDPFIHVALVCASTGCPALRNDAYTPEKVENQLLENMQLFLSDKKRNRYNSKSKTLEVSKIFKWYERDFNQGHRNIFSLKDLFSRYSEELSYDKKGQADILSKKIDIEYLDYDWRLNDLNSEQ